MHGTRPHWHQGGASPPESVVPLPPSGFVVRTGPQLSSQAIASLVRQRDAVVLLYHPTPMATGQLERFLRLGHDVRVIAVHSDDRLDATMIQRVRAILNEPDGGPVGPLFSGGSGGVCGQRLQLLATIMACGRSVASVSDYARMLSSPIRTVQASHRRHNLPCPLDALRIGRALWDSWRLSRWNITPKQAAGIAGYPSVSAMTSTLRHLLPGVTARSLHADGFDQDVLLGLAWRAIVTQH